MKRYLLSLIAIFVCLISNSQTTYINSPWSEGDGKECGRLYSVEITDEGVVVTIEVKALKALNRLNIFHTGNTYIVYNNKKILELTGLWEKNQVKTYGGIYTWGWDNVGAGETRRYSLFFRGTLPPGLTNISIIDYGDLNGAHGYNFRNCTIKNPRKNYLNYSTESSIKQHIDQNNDGICGIYEPIGDGPEAKIACIKNNGEYCLIYVSDPSNSKWKDYWQVGDIKAGLRRTASNILIADWFGPDKSKKTGYVTFDGRSIHTVFADNIELFYLKTYPLESSSVGGNTKQGKEWSGTGFALKNGYVVTNHHVVNGASSISVVGINGQNIELKADVVAVDSHNDLALIRITDYRFDGFGTIPYSINNNIADVGSDIFVLGYPLTQYMGEEIKLTDGIISSKSGYQGDMTTYQISAPIQPGNSGGPMFDKNGNVIGIVNAGIPDAENVGYAIKTTYLTSLINSSVSSSIIPNNNTLAGKSLSEKVKVLRNFVFFIKCK